ncbi:MAG: AAA family ATPase [Deltaproteobacteria bacterium]|nr:AAA family ATPase [Deltaproteobacteria bacterium]
MSTEATSVDKLRTFFETSPAAAKATKPLKKGAEVGVVFTDVPGDYRFGVETGAGRIGEGKASDPDFELELAPGAVDRLCSMQTDDLGEFAVTFFKCMLADDPEQKIGVKLHSGFLKLTSRGYLKTMALGGAKVFAFMAKNGYMGPTAVKKAIDKLRKSR